MTVTKIEEVFDVQDVIDAECNLEPIKCRHCNHIGEVTFYQSISDGYCAMCGKWQIGDK